MLLSHEIHLEKHENVNNEALVSPINIAQSQSKGVDYQSGSERIHNINSHSDFNTRIMFNSKIIIVRSYRER